MTKAKTPKPVTSLADLTPDPQNARKHNPRNIGQVQNSLQKYGAARSIVIDENNQIIAGHGVVEAAGLAGIERVRVVEADGETIIAVRRTGLTKKQKVELGIADNRGAELAEWNTEVLAGWKGSDIDLEQFWGKDELEKLVPGWGGGNDAEDPGADIDKAAELQAKWQTALGQLWAIGRHRLLVGDCTVAENVARLMGGEKADMVFTDPPYNVSSEGRNYAAAAPTQKKTYEALKNAEWDQDFKIESAFPSLELLMADDCAVYVCTSHWLVQTVWEWMWTWAKYCNYCVWCKPNPAPSLAQRHWTFATELVAYAVRGKHTCNFPDSGHALNWWEIVSPSHTTDHPTEKPLAVPIHAIEFSSMPDDIVADLFVGSGTTLVACEKLGRIGRGMELSPAYAAVTLERLSGLGLSPERIS